MPQPPATTLITFGDDAATQALAALAREIGSPLEHVSCAMSAARCLRADRAIADQPEALRGLTPTPRMILVEARPQGYREPLPGQPLDAPLVRHWRDRQRRMGWEPEIIPLLDYQARAESDPEAFDRDWMSPRERLVTLLSPLHYARLIGEPVLAEELIGDTPFTRFLRFNHGRHGALWRECLDRLEDLGAPREFYDITLAALPERYRGVAPAAIHCLQRRHHPWSQAGQSADLPTKPLLLLYGDATFPTPEAHGLDPAGRVSRYAFHAKDWRTALFRLIEKPYPADIPEAAGQTFNSAPRARRTAEVNRAVSKLLGEKMVYGRPLAHYRCTLFLPLIFDVQRLNKDEACSLVDSELFSQALKRRDRQRDEGRRLRDYYRCHRLEGASPCPRCEPASQFEKNEATRKAQCYWFFQPNIRDFLFDVRACGEDERPAHHDRGLAPIQEWRLPDSGEWQLAVGDETSGSPLQRQLASCRDIRLYRYFNGIFLLAITLAPERLADPEHDPGPPAPHQAGGDTWWHELLFSTPARLGEIQSLQFAAWLRFTQRARLLYQSFAQQWHERKIDRVRLYRQHPGGRTLAAEFPPPLGEGEAEPATNERLRIPEDAGESLSPVILRLLEAFFGEQLNHKLSLRTFFKDYRALYDDRMFVNVSYGLAGPELKAERLQPPLARALWVDLADDIEARDYAYAEKYLEPRLEKDLYRIWQDQGSLYGYSDYSNAYLGTSWYFNHIIGPQHVHYHYERMLILALFYQASLRLYANRISEATNNLATDAGHTARDRFQELRQEFIRFTNHFWFHEITSQPQGKEIFRRQQEALDLQREYDFIKDEMERADEFANGQHEKWLQRASNLFGMLGLVAVFWTMLSAIKDYPDILRTLEPLLWDPILELLGEGAGGAAPQGRLDSWWEMVGFYFGLPALSGLALWGYWGNRRRVARWLCGQSLPRLLALAGVSAVAAWLLICWPKLTLGAAALILALLALPRIPKWCNHLPCRLPARGADVAPRCWRERLGRALCRVLGYRP